MSDSGPAQSFPEPRTADSRWLRNWLLKSHGEPGSHGHATAPWWQVMCLTGVDYFSSLGYQPGIAFLAAGMMAPIATLILVCVTLGVALPVYAQVAKRSPHGQGSIMMLEELLPRWKGKAFVLVLLGFAFTDFVITMTLSAADATAHIAENPYAPEGIAGHPVLFTALLLVALGVVFLRGFGEAIGVAVGVVAVYLALNAVVLLHSLWLLAATPDLMRAWWSQVSVEHGSILGALGVSLLLFPKLALGLSGFETGVAVMPLVRGDQGDAEREKPEGRIRNTRKLLLTAAVLMSFGLLASSIATTVLVPPREFAEGGKAYGRALAYLAHEQFGDVFGTAYDVSTIAILWFAGASAMAGLLNLVPRYLPPYGMAPDWARATRPLVLIFTLIALAVTAAFDADVNAQGGAYATGVLVLMTSAAVAVTIAHRDTRARWVYLIMSLVFLYTTAVNVVERPDGIKIAAFFISGIVATSVASRTLRSTELRITSVNLGPKASEFLADLGEYPVRLIAHRPGRRTMDEYDWKEVRAREDHSLNSGEPVLFLEVIQGDASEFSGDLEVRGVRVGRHRILRAASPAIPNAIAAILLETQKRSGQISHAYFGWTEGNPIAYMLKFIFLGEGDTAPVTREVLRRAVRDQRERPRIHVG
jgi:hypothetical protein